MNRVSVLLPCVLGLAVAACSTMDNKVPVAELTDSDTKVVNLADWDYTEEVSGGLSAEQIIGTRVYGAQGDQIGSVENLVIGPDGDIRSAVVQTGGFFLGFGARYISIPWDQLELTSGAARMNVPVTASNVKRYSVFQDVSGAVEASGTRTWRATELLDDYVRLRDDESYGVVEDLIFNRQGALKTVVVTPDIDYAGGPVALPFYGYPFDFDPGFNTYDLPYGTSDIGYADPFDYGLL
jgi:sporulation protein YlmC with PRC-barrel domain